MPRKYHTQRKKERKKRDERNAQNKKTKINLTHEIICTRCGKFSGWTNDDLKFVSGEKEIKCNNCHAPCIQTFCR